jgi:hypothetical protein
LVESRRLVAQWQSALRDGPPVVTDVWWLPAAMAPLFISHEMHCVRPGGDFAQWIPLAVEHGIDTFTFASFHRLPAAHMQSPGFALVADSEQLVSGLRLTRVRVVPAPPAASAAPEQ